MTIWSCKIFQVNPDYQLEVEKLLMNVGEEYVYEEAEGNEKLTLYIESLHSNAQGNLVEIQLDRLSPPLYARGMPPRRVRVTAKLAAQLFAISGWPRLVGIFGQGENIALLRRAFTIIYRNRTNTRGSPFFSVGFKLQEREEELIHRFPNMKKLRVERIQDIYVRDAVLKGDSLEESPEYQSWVLDKDRGGVIRYFGVSVMDETVILSTDGSMYSRQGKEKRPVRTVYQILSALLECHALVYKPTIDSFI
jgi:hypothetical protein